MWEINNMPSSAADIKKALYIKWSYHNLDVNIAKMPPYQKGKAQKLDL